MKEGGGGESFKTALSRAESFMPDGAVGELFSTLLRKDPPPPPKKKLQFFFSAPVLCFVTSHVKFCVVAITLAPAWLLPWFSVTTIGTTAYYYFVNVHYKRHLCCCWGLFFLESFLLRTIWYDVIPLGPPRIGKCGNFKSDTVRDSFLAGTRLCSCFLLFTCGTQVLELWELLLLLCDGGLVELGLFSVSSPSHNFLWGGIPGDVHNWPSSSFPKYFGFIKSVALSAWYCLFRRYSNKVCSCSSVSRWRGSDV